MQSKVLGCLYTCARFGHSSTENFCNAQHSRKCRCKDQQLLELEAYHAAWYRLSGELPADNVPAQGRTSGMEIATQETAYLVDRLVDDILAPLRRDGIDIDAAARRSLRYSPPFSSRSVVGA